MKLLALATAFALIAAFASPGFAEPTKRKAKGTPPGVTEPESRAGLQQKILEQFDANGNGKLDGDEQVAARKAASERRKNKKLKPKGENGQGFNPGDGIAPIDGQQPGGGSGGPRGDGRAKFIERFDMNGDGQLNDQEMARARQMIDAAGGPGAFMGGKKGQLPPGIGGQQGRPNGRPPRKQ